MPIQPIDLQTLFMRLSQVAKQQAVQNEAVHMAQTVVGNELVREAEEQARSVNDPREIEDGPEAVKDEERQGGEHPELEEREQRRRGKKDQPNVFRDPDLGSNVDIVG